MSTRETRGEQTEQRRPLILDIKGNSLDDGPGIRTVVFFKGCPLSCDWCHNPEGKRAGPEISFDTDDCAGCDTCISVCAEKALDRAEAAFIDRERCTLCFECVERCPAGALARVGRYLEVGKVLAEVEKDLPFFRTSGGGVTLSGGEPTMFMDYTSSLLAGLREMGVHNLIETCGLFDFSEFEAKVLPLADAVYFDLKILDEEEHRKRCGTSNEPILENFRKLWALSLDSGTEVLPRVALIPGMTATDGNLRSIAGFLRETGAIRLALLQYNPLWLEKSRKIGRDGPSEGVGRWTSWMERSEIDRCKAIFEGFDLA